MTTATPKAGVVTLIILVIHFAIEQLDAKRDTVILSEFLDPIQARDAIVDAFLVAHPAPCAEQRDDVRNFGVGRPDDASARLFFQLLVIRFVIPTVGESLCPVFPCTMQGVIPYLRKTGQSAGATRSIPVIPKSAAARHRSSISILA